MGSRRKHDSNCCSVAKSCLTLQEPMDCSMPECPVLHHFPEFAQTHFHWVSDAIQLPYPLSPPSYPSFNLFQHQGLFQWVGSLHHVVKVLNFNISPSSEYTGSISFRIEWFDLLVVQGALRSHHQHHNLKSSVFHCSVLFMVNLSHPYISTGKNLALTRQTFVNKVMPLLCNILSRFVIAFLPRSKYLTISWLQSTSRVVFLALENKSLFPFSPPMCHEEMGLDGMIFGFSMLSFKPAFSLSSFRRLLARDKGPSVIHRNNNS